VPEPHRRPVLLALPLLLAAPAAAQELVLDDPLTAPYGASQERRGGTFSAAGWNRGDDFESKLIYDLGRYITHGKIEFEMDGVNGRDHGAGGWPDCRAIFAALDSDGAGDLGNQNIWIWAMDSTEICNGDAGGPPRTNRMKLLLRTLVDPEPGEPMSEELAWTESRFYRYEITWDENGGVMRRDGDVVLRNEFATPRPMQMRYVFLGTIQRYRAGVHDATYRNLKVWDCDPGQPEPDAAADAYHEPPDGVRTELDSVADTHVLSTDADNNFGTVQQMCSAGGDPWWYVAFVRFDVTGVTGPIMQATLHLQSSNPGFGGEVYPMSDTGWDEHGVTYNTRPDFDASTIIDRLGRIESGFPQQFDVTGYVPASGPVSFALANAFEGDGTCYRTREWGLAAERPRLEIIFDPDGVVEREVEPPADADVDIDTDTDSDVDTDSDSDTDTDADSDTDTGGPCEDDGDCPGTQVCKGGICRMPSGGGDSGCAALSGAEAPLLALAVLLLGAGRFPRRA